MQGKAGSVPRTSSVLPIFNRTNETRAGSQPRLAPQPTLLAPLHVVLVPGFVLNLQKLGSRACPESGKGRRASLLAPQGKLYTLVGRISIPRLAFRLLGETGSGSRWDPSPHPFLQHQNAWVQVETKNSLRSPRVRCELAVRVRGSDRQNVFGDQTEEERGTPPRFPPGPFRS